MQNCKYIIDIDYSTGNIYSPCDSNSTHTLKMELSLNNRVNRYRGLTSSATVMLGLKPFEDTIYINSAPVIEYKSGTDGFLYSIR